MLTSGLSFLFACWASSHLVDAGDGVWSKWNVWSACSVTCSQGVRRRFRVCDNPPPTRGGKYCVGSMVQTTNCTAPLQCSVDGGWTEWTDWSSCSVTCGRGFQHRYRTCTNPQPMYGGSACDGNPQERSDCTGVKECPRDGEWSKWSEWSACSVTCGKGLRRRYRSCNNPPPAADGKPCEGSNQKRQRCNAPRNCPVNGQWSKWSDWSACSVTCGEGRRERHRSCNNPPPQHGGLDCNQTDNAQIENCLGDVFECAVDGEWSNWSKFGPCETPDCKVLVQVQDLVTFRERSCNNPLPAHGGAMCRGSFLDVGLCSAPSNCKVDGGWSPWSEWSCSSEQAKRTRKCNRPKPSNGGRQCPPQEGEQWINRDTNEDEYKGHCEEDPDYDDYEEEEVQDH